MDPRSCWSSRAGELAPACLWFFVGRSFRSPTLRRVDPLSGMRVSPTRHAWSVSRVRGRLTQTSFPQGFSWTISRTARPSADDLPLLEGHAEAGIERVVLQVRSERYTSPVVQGHWKLLAPLEPGDNELEVGAGVGSMRLHFGAMRLRRARSACDCCGLFRGTAMGISFDAPEGEASDRETAHAKMVLWGRMVQSLTAGGNARTGLRAQDIYFQLDEAKHVTVEDFRSRLTQSQAAGMDSVAFLVRTLARDLRIFRTRSTLGSSPDELCTLF